MGLRLAALGLLAGVPLGVVTLPQALPAASAAPAPAAERTNHVLEQRVLGRSVRGRELRAWHLDNTRAGRHPGPTVVLIATMHGNEGAPRQILRSLRSGAAVHGADLWLVPVYNPDGLAAHGRRNAHGVDLNRNYPYHWADLDGSYESGPRPGSEPETRAMMRFLTDIDPDYVLSFHQPLHGVDTDTKSPKFSRKVARHLDLPRKSFTCGGVCHGTMTGWFNSRFKGSAVTVEYGAHPGHRRLARVAPRQLLGLWGAHRG
jgi:protein MpaA